MNIGGSTSSTDLDFSGKAKEVQLFGALGEQTLCPLRLKIA
jgi:hypothetical protein